MALRRNKFGVVPVSLAFALVISGCVTPEQAERRDANAAREAATKSLVFQGCYPVLEDETKNAQRIIDTQGGGDGLYWAWWPNRRGATLINVNAKTNVEVTPSCLQRFETTCQELGLEPASGFVTRDQAAAGRGEITVKCSPRLEQT